MDKRWKQITLTDYAKDREALKILCTELPDHEPYRTWANLDFITKE